MAATSSSSTSVTIPPALAFLVSNFNSLVNIKLDPGNYLLWKTQVLNAFRANGYIGFLDGTTICPASTVMDSTNNSVVNPEFTMWTLIDNQLLSCLTASLSSTTLPHVLGLVHTSQVWLSLAQRFNSQSRSHIHELKGRLYSVTKTGTMESYIDEVRNHAQRLEAVGYHVEDDDLVFYTINGLPKEEFRNFKTAIRTRGSDITFEELAAILKSEEVQIHQDDLSSAKVFMTTSKVGNPNFLASSSSGGLPITQGSEGHQSSVLGQYSPQVQPQLQSHTQMFQPSSNSGQNYPNQYHSGQNYPNQYPTQFSQNQNRNRGSRGSGYGGNQRVSCQICGKTNHTALYCHHRQNLQYQPFSPMNSGRSNFQTWQGNQGGPQQFLNQQTQLGYNSFSSPQNHFGGMMMGYQGMPNFSGPSQYNGSSTSQQMGSYQSSQFPRQSIPTQFNLHVALIPF